MQLLFISGKYRGKSIFEVYENIQIARRYAIKYWQKGYAVICPHTNSALFDGSCDDDVWLKGDLYILKRCDVIVMLPGWKESQGAVEEHKLAQQIGLQIIYEE